LVFEEEKACGPLKRFINRFELGITLCCFNAWIMLIFIFCANKNYYLWGYEQNLLRQALKATLVRYMQPIEMKELTLTNN
jgi:hypothetical protein